MAKSLKRPTRYTKGDPLDAIIQSAEKLSGKKADSLPPRPSSKPKPKKKEPKPRPTEDEDEDEFDDEDDDDISVGLKVTNGLEMALSQMDPEDHVKVGMQILEWRHHLKELPEGPLRAQMLHQSIDVTMEYEKEEAEKEGHTLPQISCKKGCNSCCQQMVYVTSDEAILMADLLREKYGQNIPDKIMSYLRDQARYEAHQALDFWALPKSKSACVFLNPEGLCDIYADRPAACRTFAVTSHPSLCTKEASQTGSGMVDRTFSLGAEAWSSAAINIANAVNDPLPISLLRVLEGTPHPQTSTAPQNLQSATSTKAPKKTTGSERRPPARKPKQ